MLRWKWIYKLSISQPYGPLCCHLLVFYAAYSIEPLLTVPMLLKGFDRNTLSEELGQLEPKEEKLWGRSGLQIGMHLGSEATSQACHPWAAHYLTKCHPILPHYPPCPIVDALSVQLKLFSVLSISPLHTPSIHEYRLLDNLLEIMENCKIKLSDGQLFLGLQCYSSESELGFSFLHIILLSWVPDLRTHHLLIEAKWWCDIEKWASAWGTNPVIHQHTNITGQSPFV